MKKILFSIIAICFVQLLFSQNIDSLEKEQAKILKKMEAREKEIVYQSGEFDVNNMIHMNVPKGYKFIAEKDANYIVSELWGNPKDEFIKGMLVKEDFISYNSDQWAFVMSYADDGYVSDEDADKIDYKELKKNEQESEVEANKTRAKDGFDAIHFVDWASAPYYDKQEKILHWAKILVFGTNKDSVLNYDVRILGRQGLISMNAVGSINDLLDIKTHIPEIIHAASFKAGNKYTDFDGKTDKIAAYTIGGLVAGKLLAKVGIFALLLKNIKLVILAILAFFGGFKNKIMGFFGRKKEDAVAELPK